MAGRIFVCILIKNVQAASQLLQLHASVPATAAAAPIPAVAAAAPIPAVAAAAPIPAVAAAAPIPAVAAAAPVPAVAAAAPILNHGPWRGKFLVIEFYSVILGIYTGPSLGYLWWCPFREYLQRWWARLTHILGPLRIFNLPND